MSHLSFPEVGRSASGKTRINDVVNRGGAVLGRISWYAPWRRYCVETAPGVIFDAECLREIAARLQESTDEQKAIQRGHAQAREQRDRI